MHEQWRDNVFVTLNVDKQFDELAAQADVVVRRKIDLARQCMVPMEGKAVLAYWDHQADQLVVVSATQVPHMIRSVLASAWRDNVFVTLNVDKFDELAAQADVVVRRKIDLARQCMVPMEGKAVLAYWDHQADQLVVVSAAA